jgi:TRAP-type C4-dicarboxylate transport system permease small subunit
MKRYRQIMDKIAYVCGLIGSGLVPIMVFMVAVEVFMRYVLKNPPMIADEFSAYMLVALSYLGLAVTWRQGGHVRITLLVSRLPVKLAGWLRLVVLIIIFIFMVAITHSAFSMVVYAYEINLRSDTWLTFPLIWPQLTVFIGFLMLTLLLPADIVKVYRKIRAGESVEKRPK